jgi:zinc transporter ZupT
MKAAVTVSDLGLKILGTLLVDLLGRRLCLGIGFLALVRYSSQFSLVCCFFCFFLPGADYVAPGKREYQLSSSSYSHSNSYSPDDSLFFGF